MMDTSAGAGRDSRFNLGYNMSLLSGETSPEMYGGRPSTSINSGMSRSGMNMSGSCAPGLGLQRGLKRTSSDVCFVDQDVSGRASMGLTGDCGSDLLEDSYSPAPQKSAPPPNGKKTKGRVKIKMEYIDNKLRRYTTFSKRKTGIMKKVCRPSVGDGTLVPCAFDWLWTVFRRVSFLRGPPSEVQLLPAASASPSKARRVSRSYFRPVLVLFSSWCSEWFECLAGAFGPSWVV